MDASHRPREHLVRRPLVLTALLALGLGSLAGLPGGSAPVDDACVAGSADQAARALLHPQAVVLGTEVVAGIETASVDKPLVHPGTRDRLLRHGDGWCTVAAFTDVTGLVGTDAATAFAQLAPVAWFDEVLVRGEPVELGVDGLGRVLAFDTWAATNGITASWQVRLDGAGRIADATFTTTGIGIGQGFTAQLEGITSLPGHARTWRADDGGLLVVDESVEQQLATAALQRVERLAAGIGPTDQYLYTASDGFEIHLQLFGSPFTPDHGITSGVAPADRNRTILDWAATNYEDFLDWGLEDRWPDDVGTIGVDSYLAPVCLACAVITEGMDIHVLTVFPEAAEPLVNVSYEDNEEFFAGVIGHEIVHAFQNGYSGAEGRALTSAYIEGLARSTESFHDTAHGSHQPGSITYNASANGCNGFDDNIGWVAAMALGPFADHTYDACFFWLSFLSGNGAHDGFVALLENLQSAVDLVDAAGHVERNMHLLAQVSPNWREDLAAWGAGAVARAGYLLPPMPGEPELDWAIHLADVPAAATLSRGDSFEAVVQPAGVSVVEVLQAGSLSTSGSAKRYVVTVRGNEIASVVRHTSTTSVSPSSGTRTFLVFVGDDPRDIGEGSVRLS